MPRYHFHIIDAVNVFDTKGIALPDERAARLHARVAARNFNRNLKGEKVKVRVTDEKGQTICEAQPDSRD